MKKHLSKDANRKIAYKLCRGFISTPEKTKTTQITKRHLMQLQLKLGNLKENATIIEKDLGVTKSADMKVSEQRGIAASRGNQILGLIRRNITYKEKELYKAIGRPHLELCTSLETIQDIGTPE